MKQYYQAQKYLVKILEQRYNLKNKDALFAAKTAKKEYEYFPDLSIQPSEDLNEWADKIYNKYVKDTYPELESIQIPIFNGLTWVEVILLTQRKILCLHAVNSCSWVVVYSLYSALIATTIR